MSIGNNTTGLQRILQAVNELPEGGSGGVTVREDTGNITFLTSAGSSTATITCGYKPDAVVVTVSGYPDVCVIFDSDTSVESYAGNNKQQTYPLFFVTVKQTSTGVSLSGAQRINWSWEPSNYTGSADYRVIKFTE